MLRQRDLSIQRSIIVACLRPRHITAPVPPLMPESDPYRISVVAIKVILHLGMRRLRLARYQPMDRAKQEPN